MTNYLQQKTLYLPQVRRRTARNLGMCIIIPALDEPFLLRTLLNLQKCTLPKCAVEVIVVINNHEQAPSSLVEKNRAVYLQALAWAKENFRPELRFHILFFDDLPKPFAGVDLARKIGMDEAVFRLEKAGRRPGIIAVLDADARVEKNYFTALEAHFRRRNVPRVCVTKFHFPDFGLEYKDERYTAGKSYELYLNYLGKKRSEAGFAPDYSMLPGSFAVDVKTYQKAGGWSSPVGKTDLLKQVHLLTKTDVQVSPRPSKRNPEGTAGQVQKAIKNKGSYPAYHPQAFKDLTDFFQKNEHRKEIVVKELTDCPDCLNTYFKEVNFIDCKLEEERFIDFFADYHLKAYLEFAHQSFYTKIPIETAVKM